MSFAGRSIVALLLAVVVGVGVLVGEVLAAGWGISQLTTNGSQQNGPIISGNTIVWKDFRGPLGTDVWGYNLKTKAEFPIVQDEGFQSPTAIQGNNLLYDEYLDGSDEENVWLMNIKNGQKKLIAGGSGSRGGSHMDGNWVVYIEGAAVGTLHAYNLKTKENSIIANDAYRPRVSNGKVVWSHSVGGGLSGISGYDLMAKQSLNLPNGADISRDLPDIYGNKVVWEEGGAGPGRIMMYDLTNNQSTTIRESEDDVSYPTVSGQYVAWQQIKDFVNPGDTQVSAASRDVWVKDLKTGQATQLTNEGPQQTSPFGIASIFGNRITWFSWKTGNGDVYLAEYKKK